MASNVDIVSASADSACPINSPSEAKTLMSKNAPFKSSWIVDCRGGHIVNDKCWFHEFSQNHANFQNPNGPRLAIEAYGTVNLCLHVPGFGPSYITLNNVAYAPESACNILSLASIDEDDGLSGTWGSEGICISNEDEEYLATAILVDGLYRLRVYEPASWKDRV